MEPYLVASSLRGIISQRLVRKICTDCKTEYNTTKEELRVLGLSQESNVKLFRGKGCNSCHGTGYRGRTAVHEIMVITEKHRELISRRASSDKLDRVSRDAGMMTLRENCARLVMKGITTVEEMAGAVYLNE